MKKPEPEAEAENGHCRKPSLKIAKRPFASCAFCAFWRLFLRPVAFPAVKTRSKQASPMFQLKIDANRMHPLHHEHLATQILSLGISARFDLFRPVSTKKINPKT
ncbi:MAG: hypothetical protein ACLQU4_17230 [Limisphaerales bacterium]